MRLILPYLQYILPAFAACIAIVMMTMRDWLRRRRADRAELIFGKDEG